MREALIKRFIPCLLVALLLFAGSGCADTTTPASPRNPSGASANTCRDSYDEFLRGFQQEDITQSVKKSDAASEYRVLCDYSLARLDYYRLQVFQDGSGQLVFLSHQPDVFTTGEIVNDQIVKLTKEQTDGLLMSITQNDFWNIPTVHPDEKAGCDGTVVYVEGCSGGKTHYIKMWEPDEKYGIYQIHKAFAYFAESMAETPTES